MGAGEQNRRYMQGVSCLCSCGLCRSRLGVRRVPASSEPDAVVSAVDRLVLLHAVSARYRQPGAVTYVLTYISPVLRPALR